MSVDIFWVQLFWKLTGARRFASFHQLLGFSSEQLCEKKLSNVAHSFLQFPLWTARSMLLLLGHAWFPLVDLPCKLLRLYVCTPLVLCKLFDHFFRLVLVTRGCEWYMLVSVWIFILLITWCLRLVNICFGFIHFPCSSFSVPLHNG